jgi:predicted nucleotidyltransferase
MATAVATRQEIVDRIRSQRDRIRGLGAERLGLFGSFARGESRGESDVDLLVQFAPGKKSFDNFLDLAELLEEFLARQVELVTLESLSPYIGPHILAEVQDVPLGT